MLLLKNPQFHARYYNWLSKLLKVEGRIQFHEIDWNKPWWQVYGLTKLRNVVMTVTIILESGFTTCLPLIVAFLITNPNPIYYFYLIFLIILMLGIFTVGYSLNIFWDCVISRNIIHSANQYFLNVDPIYHTTKNSGQIISKIDRASSKFIELNANLMLDILPNIIAIITGVTALFLVDFRLGVIGAIGMSLILGIGTYLRVFNNIVFRDYIIAAEDSSKSITVESLAQVNYIRSTFSTLDQIKQSSKTNSKAVSIWTEFWSTSMIADMILFFIQVIFALIIAYYLGDLINNNGLNIVTGLAGIATYFTGTSRVIIFGSKIKRLIEAEYNIRDLFNFIQSFGHQSFPVVEPKNITK
jgi:ABC-type bacteriocin/lantibiotic exporter with double-glycine peptidase domain